MRQGVSETQSLEMRIIFQLLCFPYLVFREIEEKNSTILLLIITMSATFFNLLALGAQMPTGIYYQGENSMAGDQTRYLSRSLEIVLLKSSFLPFTGSLSHILTFSKVGTEKATHSNAY